MKKPLDIKKLLILNLPYILLGLFATNFGEAWRMAQGALTQEALPPVPQKTEPPCHNARYLFPAF